jgi:activating signal cointegrator 1
MKVLTLTQPFATLVAVGAKTIETRSWSTKYRGPLAIHAAKAFPVSAQELCATPIFEQTLRQHMPGYLYIEDLYHHLPLGQIIATCTLDACFLFTEENVATIGEPERSFGDYAPGRYGFRLTTIRKLITPVPARGRLGLWTYDGDL